MGTSSGAKVKRKECVMLGDELDSSRVRGARKEGGEKEDDEGCDRFSGPAPGVKSLTRARAWVCLVRWEERCDPSDWMVLDRKERSTLEREESSAEPFNFRSSRLLSFIARHFWTQSNNSLRRAKIAAGIDGPETGSELADSACVLEPSALKAQTPAFSTSFLVHIVASFLTRPHHLQEGPESQTLALNFKASIGHQRSTRFRKH